MYRVINGSINNLRDAEDFLGILNSAQAREFFCGAGELVVARAPGRLDVMGGIADYSGSLVLQLPISEATFVALERNQARSLNIISLGAGHDGQALKCSIGLADLERGGDPIDYRAARLYFQRDAQTAWAAYVAGAFLVLMRERGIHFSEGANILISSRVPQGKGVSSSAAIEVAVMQAIAVAQSISIEPVEMALLCQKVENLVVGAPCGVMDQMTAVSGEAHALLALKCQPAQLEGMVRLPDDLEIFGIDSGIRHSVSGADYSSVRVGAFMGYRIIAELAGLTNEASTEAQAVEVDDPWWGGYLANISPSQFEQFYSRRLPEKMSGSEFLACYKGTTDKVTLVDAERVYGVRAPAAHPVYENFRVRLFAELLNATSSEQQIKLLGELMYQSHASYSACGLGTPGTDLLVQLVREAGPGRGLYGARITGGGSGGTVAVLGRRNSFEAIRFVAARYKEQTGHEPYIFQGSSDGAARFGHLRLAKEG